jgi:hypothetical protein
MSRIFIASVLASVLWWGTAEAVIVVVCRLPRKISNFSPLPCFYFANDSPRTWLLAFSLIPSLCSTLHSCLTMATTDPPSLEMQVGKVVFGGRYKMKGETQWETCEVSLFFFSLS